jgi:uncharacterized protein
MSEEFFDELGRWLGSRRKGVVYKDDLLGLYAESLEESVFVAAQPSTPDCLTCGACCAYFHQILISLEDSTPRSLAWEVLDSDEQVTHWLRRQPGNGHCLAFDGRVSASARCTIYELRPTACRAFEAGSDRCHALRRMYGLEPPLADSEYHQHRQNLKAHHLEEKLDFIGPDGLEGDDAGINLLRKLIAYNLSKLDAILTELKRLKELFHEKGANQAAENCLKIYEIINHESQFVSDEVLSLTTECEKASEAERQESSNRYLEIANASQTLLESAGKRLAEMGELAFEVLGMKSKF